jgi:hypothetical protein
MLAASRPQHDYANLLAEPWHIMCQAKSRGFRLNVSEHLMPNQNASNAAYPGLGTRIGLAQGLDSPRSVASLQVLGRAGASPHQVWSLLAPRF